MLSEINIQNFAIINNLSLRFSGGFDVLTGETGAGKSIVLDAVSLLLGGRADSDAVRTGAKAAIIEGIFEIPKGDLLSRINKILEREELEDPDGGDSLVLTREMRKNGRSICRVNGHTTTVAILKEVGEGLVDIHGQSEHLTLLRPASHLDLLDRYGGLMEQRADYAKLVKEIETVRGELNHLRHNEQSIKQRAEILAFQIEEVTAAKLKPGEDEELRDSARRLANAEQLASLIGEAYQAVYGGGEETIAANDALTQAANALARLVRIDETAKELADLAEELSIQVEELGRGLADYQEGLEFDPVLLQETEMRLDMITMLKRKYNAESIEELLALTEEAQKELETIEHSDERLEELQEREARLLLEIGEMGATLSRARIAAADTISRAVEAELTDLKMESARFGVSIEQVDDPEGAVVGDYRLAFDRTGIDQVEFLIAPNIGEPLKPIARIASGGETARIMLALKTVLSRADQTPSLIFDEIDAGIGGRIGAIVGQKLWSLSHDHQVLVVTHLPQLAGFGDSHFKVEKQVADQRTETQISLLDEGGRVEELAAMLGAESGASRQNAEEILQYVRQIKQAAPSVG